MSTSIPKFLSCDNFMEDSDGEYVLHTQEPKFLAKWNDENEGFDIVDEYDNISDFFSGDETKITTLFEAMAEWFMDYDEWLDEEDG